MEKWVIRAGRADYRALAEEFGVDPLLVRLMANRGAATSAEIKKYLHATLANLYDAALLKDGAAAAGLLLETIGTGGIVIASDFDVDGIFAGSLLQEVLSALGARVRTLTPHRVLEGYGLNRRIVDDAVSLGASVILTCDNGIAAFDAIDYAVSLGLKVIVTDHHDIARDEEGRPRLPAASAIVNPKQEDCPYPFKKLCGAAVAYKVAELLCRRAGRGFEALEACIPYVAIATVADVMDLEDENRIFVRIGLRMLSETKHIGLRAILDCCLPNEKTITAYHIGFVIGPCFNAAGRLETVSDALALLRAANPETAMALAEKLKSLNIERKALTKAGYEEAVAVVERDGLDRDDVLVVHLPDCHESLAGIIAGRLRERYGKPCFVITGAGEVCKGSGRSIEAYHMYRALHECRELLLRFGGHPMAAGLSLERNKINLLKNQLNANSHLTDDDFCAIVKIDAAMPPEYATQELVTQLALLEPCGKGNARALFAGSRFRIRHAQVLGRERKVLRFEMIGEHGTPCQAIYFGDVELFAKDLRDAYGEDAWARLLADRAPEISMAFTYYPDINEYRGRCTLQFVIQNYRCL